MLALHFGTSMETVPFLERNVLLPSGSCNAMVVFMSVEGTDSEVVVSAAQAAQQIPANTAIKRDLRMIISGLKLSAGLFRQ